MSSGVSFLLWEMSKAVLSWLRSSASCITTVEVLLLNYCGHASMWHSNAETVESDQSLAAQALAAAEQRAAEYEGLLEDAQLKFESVAKHRKSAQKQLDAQEEDLEHLGHRLKVFFPSSRIQSLFVTNPHYHCVLAPPGISRFAPP